MLEQLINFQAYSTTEIFFYWTGFFLWAVAYVIMMFRIPKEKFVDMPFIVASGNIAWEFLWATVLSKYLDMGPLLVWLYRVGFLFDVWIFYNVYKYGAKQLAYKSLVPNFGWLLTGITVAWLFIFYFYTTLGNDTPLGMYSAMQLNLVISPLCVSMLLRLDTTKGFLLSVGWLKMLGTLFVTIFSFIHFPQNHYIHIVGILIAVFDNWYIALWYRIRAREVAVVPVSAAQAKAAA